VNTSCPQARTIGEVCGCETCVLTRLMATSPTRPMDPAQLSALVAQSRTREDAK